MIVQTNDLIDTTIRFRVATKFSKNSFPVKYRSTRKTNLLPTSNVGKTNRLNPIRVENLKAEPETLP